MDNITHANDVAAFERDVLSSPTPVLVDFWASWCAPCQLVAPEIHRIAGAYDERLRVVKVDVDSNRDVAAKYGIMSIPTLALFRDGRLVRTSVGAKRASAIEADLGLTDLVV